MKEKESNMKEILEQLQPGEKIQVNMTLNEYGVVAGMKYRRKPEERTRTDVAIVRKVMKTKERLHLISETRGYGYCLDFRTIYDNCSEVEIVRLSK